MERNATTKIHLCMDGMLDHPHPTPHTIFSTFFYKLQEIYCRKYSFETEIYVVLKLKCNFWNRAKYNWKYRNTCVNGWASILLDRPYPALLDHIPQYTLFRPNGHQFLPSDWIHFKQLCREDKYSTLTAMWAWCCVHLHQIFAAG